MLILGAYSSATPPKNFSISLVKCFQKGFRRHRITKHRSLYLFQYKNGAIADISSAILLRKPNEGYVYGSKGYAHLRRFYAPQEIEVHLNSGETETISTPYAGNGFEEQITHFCECVSLDLMQSPVITHDQTLFITRQMDEIRKMTGIIYPQDEQSNNAKY